MLYIIANPLSGSGKGKETASLVEKELIGRNVPYTLCYTQYQGHAIKLAEDAARSGAHAVIALGGDGTLHEVVCGMAGSDKPLGIISAGTGNDFIRSAGIPSEPLKALEIILSGKTKKTDCLDVNGVRCLNVAGTGLDVDILVRANKYRSFSKSHLSYYLALIITLIVFPFRRFTFRIDDGEERTETGMLIALANGKMYGGGLPVAPDACLDDGYIDFVLIKKFPRIKLPYLLIKFLKGKLLELKYVEWHRCKRAEMNVEPALPANIDGEMSENLPLKAQILPGAISIFTP